MLSITTVVPTILFLSLVLIRFQYKSRRNFPPGPPPLPFIGNLHQLPTRKLFLVFARWSTQYASPIIGLHLGPHPTIVLNSWRTVRDLFDARGAIYSSRPDVPLVAYVVPGNYHVAFMKHDKAWRRGRAAITGFLRNEQMTQVVLLLQEAEATQMVWEVCMRPDEYASHVMRQFGAVMLAAVYGRRGTRRLTERFFAVQDQWTALLDLGASPPLDVWPWLKWVPDVVTPWRGWRRRAAGVKEAQSVLYKELFERGRRGIAEGGAGDSFLKKLLEGRDKEGFSDEELVYIAGFLLEAGADTTANGLLTFLLAMAAHPDVQKRAQGEIDEVFGEEMPREVDTGKLSYLQAIYWETLRWRPSFPMSLPHATSKDDTYDGYFIPSGSTVIMNTWAIHHNEDDYPNSDIFDPTRFLTNDFGTAVPLCDLSDASRRRTYAFGAGRRVCAGQDMAEKSLLLSMAKILWAFDMRPEDGGKLDTSIDTAFRDAVLTGPKDVGIDFKVRSETRKAVIAEEWERADAFLKRFE